MDAGACVKANSSRLGRPFPTGFAFLTSCLLRIQPKREMLCTQVVYVTRTLDLDSPLHRWRSHVSRAKDRAKKEQNNRTPDLATRNSIAISLRLPCQPGVAGWRTTLRILVRRIFGCWHLDLGRPITDHGETYRVCLKCGAHRRFNPASWKTVGKRDYGSGATLPDRIARLIGSVRGKRL